MDITPAEKNRQNGKKNISIVGINFDLYEKVSAKCEDNGIIVNTLNRKIIEKGYREFLDADIKI